ncbi:hypothetical protein ED407_07855, partial [Listeria monocytogenes]|nr:hypothetical protein [Listeria monocytogenes]EAC6924305.1 hypothetical protein [Listeria monocytogenes]EAD5309133.1 hypothetical protein [Listeria monocytogenes]EAE7056392.1 hypothetical protein [Listeria monocytogenes]EAF9672595.1 hypothetical protein [Listeria monocytogenes]
MNSDKTILIRAEMLQISQYVQIIKDIASTYPGLSIFKLTTFCYLKKIENGYYKSIYSNKNSKDLVFKGISQMTGKYEDFIQNIKYIVKALDILICNQIIYSENDLIYSNIQGQSPEPTDFLSRVIKESFLYTD